ncbi:MAG: hypothetical protein EKK45_20750 [Curvibacter sp.]|nr:MAG: hypothetical protein EKK45_20750 [Curvibacter sp.]
MKALTTVIAAFACIASASPPALAEGAAGPATNADQWLGLDEAALPGVVPEVQRLRRPQSGPHGLKASWALPMVTLDQGQLQTLFFTRQRAVVHVQQQWRADPTRCQAGIRYQALVTRFNQQLGRIGVATGDAQTQEASTAWAAGAYDVRLYMDQRPGNCRWLLVHELHAERDPSEL